MLLQSSSSGLSSTTMSVQSKQKIGCGCESFARSLRTGWIFKCNLREVIEVHVNQFCFVKIFTLTQYVCPEINLILLVLLEIIRPRQNNKNFVLKEWLV